MKKILKMSLILICLTYFSFVSVTVGAQGREKVVVGIDIHLPPMGFRDSNGEITGFDVELARETFKILGKEVIFQPIDWDAKELELNTGKIDVVWNGLSYTRERAQNMLLTKSYMQNRQVIIVKDNSSIYNFNDLYDKLICVQNGSTVVNALKDSDIGRNAKNIVKLENMIDCINEIKLNKCDAAIVDEVFARYYLNKNSLQSEFRLLDEEFSKEDYVIGLKKGNTELKDQLENALNQLIESKVAAEISERWIGKNVVSFAQTKETETENDFDESYNVKELFCGLKTTIKLFIVCFIFSIPLGLILCMLNASRFYILKAFVKVYVWVMRSTPLLLQIFFIFYGIPLLFPALKITDRFLIGCLAFILNYSAYFSEIFRGGLKSISKGQWEAIKVLQIKKSKAISKIIIPQVTRVCLPSICNETITLVKDTALIFSIGVVELLTTAKNLVNTKANVMPYIIVTVIYLIICSAITAIFKYLENKLKFE